MTSWGDKLAASARERLSSVVVATALAALIVLGVLAVLVFTVRALQTASSTAAMTVAVVEVTEDALATTAALQEERALGSIMTHDFATYRALYEEAITRTDLAFQDLRVAWSRHRTQVPSTATPPISDVLAAQVSLTDFREATLTPNGESTFSLYTEVVGLSLAATLDLMKQTDDPALSDRARIIADLLNVSEALHARRFMIQEALAANEAMSEESLLQFDVVTSNLRQGLFQARSLAEGSDLEAVEEIMSGPAAEFSEDLVQVVTSSDDIDHGITVEAWFDAASGRIDLVNDLIPRIHADVAGAAFDTLNRAERDLWSRSILLSALFILAILVASNAVFATRERGEALAEYGQLTDGLRAWFVAASFPDADNVDIAARYVPASIRTMSGGDWYDAQMAQLRNILRGQSTALTLEPADQIDLLSRAIFESGIVATLTYGLLDPVTGEFIYTRAGHIPLLIRTASGGVRIEEEAPGPPVGAGIDLEREQKVTRLEPGDTLILITDGLVEGLDRDIDLALDQIAKILARTEISSEELLDELFSMNTETPIDDAAALLITWNPLRSAQVTAETSSPST
jgi:hypothetical protein